MASNKLDNIKTIHDEDIDVKNRRVYVFDDINNDTAKYLVQNLHFLDMSDGDINIYFNTNGGEWDDAIAMFNAIRNCKSRVLGHVIGTCSSSGSIILQACDHRIMHPYTSMLIHPGGASHDGTVRDFMSRAGWEAKVLDSMFEIYHNRMKLAKGEATTTLQLLKKKFNSDKYVFAYEALQLGLIDEIYQTNET
jgi:ATP-dependent protease ClpP protease subunit